LSKIDDENITDKQKFSNKNLFVTWQKNISNIDVNAGIRHINHSEFDTHTVYNTGIGKNLINGIKITANYNTAFDESSLFEVYVPLNPTKLKPETSINIRRCACGFVGNHIIDCIFIQFNIYLAP
jgi:vitamin B12 transporter